MTSKEFGELVRAKMDELVDGMTVAEIVKTDMLEVNKEAIRLVQQELTQ